MTVVPAKSITNNFEDNNDDDEFKGVFKLSVTKKELLIILAPFVLKLVGSYLSNLLDSGFYFNLIFGLMHIGNIVNGAKLSIALIQGIATIFGGFLFMALYLRTGSIWPSIIAHGIYDYMCFVTDPNLNEGIMVNEAVTTGLILTLVIYIVSGLWALYLIRPAVKDKIEAVWNEKWSITDL